MRLQETNHIKPKPISVKTEEEFFDELKDYPVVQSILGSPSCTAVIGKPRSGKSSFVFSLLEAHKLAKKYDDVFIITKRATIGSMMENEFMKDVPKTNIFLGLNAETMHDIERRMASREKELGRRPRSLLILDDVQAALKSKGIADAFVDFAASLRHRGLCLVVLLQTLMCMDKKGRELFTNVVVMPHRSPMMSLDEIHRRLLGEMAHSRWRQLLNLKKWSAGDFLAVLELGGGDCYVNFNKVLWDEEPEEEEEYKESAVRTLADEERDDSDAEVEDIIQTILLAKKASTRSKPRGG